MMTPSRSANQKQESELRSSGTRGECVTANKPTELKVIIAKYQCVIEAGAFSALLILCGCEHPPTKLYEPPSHTGEWYALTRTHLARCRAGHLHRPQLDELIKKLTASLGGLPVKEYNRCGGGSS